MVGDTIESVYGDTFVVGERVAVGSMSEVFRGRAVDSGEAVAIKCLLPQFSNDETLIQMFLEEAALGARLEHPNLVPALDLGRAGETYFSVFPWIDGPSLEALLPKLPSGARDGIVTHIVGRIALALDALHTLKDEAGAAMEPVHRDVCPRNILVGRDGVPRLIDLGISRVAQQHRTSQTPSGTLKGRIASMSPEQVRGIPVDGRGDVFALGVVLYEALTGQPAYGEVESEFDLLMQVRNGAIIPLRTVRPDIPPALEAVVARALVADRDARWPTAAAFAAALADAESVAELDRSTQDVQRAVAAAFPSVTNGLERATVLDDLEALPPARRR